MSGRRFFPTKWEISLALDTESASHIVDVIFRVFSKNCLFPRQKWPNLKPAKKSGYILFNKILGKNGQPYGKIIE